MGVLEAVSRDLEDGGRQVDEVQWRQQLVDLQQVMNCVRSAYLTLEHFSEPILRVAVELVTCPSSRRVLWWTDAWSGEYRKREEFKELIRDKFVLAVAHAKNTKPVYEEKETVSMEDFEELKGKLQEVERVKNVVMNQQQIAELRCRELEESSDGAKKQVEALENSLTQLRSQLRDLMDRPEVDPSIQERLDELEAKFRASERERQVLTRKLEASERELKASEEALKASEDALRDSQSALKASEEALQDAQKAQKEALEELKRSQSKPPVEVVKEVVPEGLMEGHQKEVQAMQDQLADAQAELERMRAEMASLRQEVEEERQRSKELAKVLADKESQASLEDPRIKELQAALKRAQQEARDANEFGQQATPQLSKAKTDSEELEALRAELETTTGKLGKREEHVRKLKDENADLEEEKLRMLKMIHQLKEQLRRVQEIAEKKGYGKLVADILEEAKVTESLESQEFSCFERLYEDAMRRQRKHMELDAARFSSGESWRPRPAFLRKGGKTMDSQGHPLQPRINMAATMPAFHSSGTPYRHHNMVYNCPCLRCGFVPVTGGYHGESGHNHAIRFAASTEPPSPAGSFEPARTTPELGGLSRAVSLLQLGTAVSSSPAPSFSSHGHSSHGFPAPPMPTLGALEPVVQALGRGTPSPPKPSPSPADSAPPEPPTVVQRVASGSRPGVVDISFAPGASLRPLQPSVRRSRSPPSAEAATWSPRSASSTRPPLPRMGMAATVSGRMAELNRQSQRLPSGERLPNLASISGPGRLRGMMLAAHLVRAHHRSVSGSRERRRSPMVRAT